MKWIFSETSTEGWVGIFTALGTAIVAVIGAIFGGWKYLKVEDNKTMLELKKIELADKKKDKAKSARELEEAIDNLITDREKDRKEIHELRDKCQTYMLKHVEVETRLENCEDDRKELRQIIEEIRGNHGN